jgi:hypothetical protein
MVTRAALEEQRKNILMDCRTEACCPADDLELVCIADSVHVATCIQKRANYFNSTRTSREVQRVCVVADISCIYIGAMLEQESYGIQVLNCLMQSCRPIPSSLANQAGLSLEKFAQRHEITGTTRRKECVGCRRATPFDFRFECSPAWESILSSDCELSISEFRSRIFATEPGEIFFRSLFQILERRAFRQL